MDLKSTCDSNRFDFPVQHEEQYWLSDQTRGNTLSLAKDTATPPVQHTDLLDWHFESPSTGMRFWHDQILHLVCLWNRFLLWRCRNAFRVQRMHWRFQGERTESIRRWCQEKEGKLRRGMEWCTATQSELVCCIDTSSTSHPPMAMPLIGCFPYGKGWDNIGTLGFACVESFQVLFKPYTQ